MIPTTRLGMLTPSSNTVLEPVTAAMLNERPSVSVHFSRFRVLKIALDENSLKQFHEDPILEAADLLADAKTNTICWNGTSSGWLGFESDRQLCRQIQERTGIRATTSVLALNEILRITNATKIAFVTPYLHNIQSAIINNYQSEGFEVVAEQHLNDPGNYSFSDYTTDEIENMCRCVAIKNPEAICVFCTNFRGASIAEKIEEETGIPVYDTVSTALWSSLKMVGIDPAAVRGWGSIFNVK